MEIVGTKVYVGSYLGDKEQGFKLVWILKMSNYPNPIYMYIWMEIPYGLQCGSKMTDLICRLEPVENGSTRSIWRGLGFLRIVP